MRTLPLQDQRHLEAAEGWLGLAAWTEASEELEQICPSLRGHPYVLFVRYEVLAQAQQWVEAVEIAQTLAFLFPERPEAWICYAYATRRKSERGLVDAKAILVQAATRFPADYLIRYNLACYECLLGNLNAASLWLERAFVLADSTDLCLKALADDEIQPLWGKIREIC